MQIKTLVIKNFKSIQELSLQNLENALILVGKNSTGKTAVLEAVRAVSGSYNITKDDFRDISLPVSIYMELSITEEDLALLHRQSIVSKYRGYEPWLKDFQKKLPSYQNGVLSFTYTKYENGLTHYSDGIKKENSYIPTVFPKIYYIDTQRNLDQFQKDLLLWMEDDLMKQMRSDSCLFDVGKKCNHCFECIGLLSKKAAGDLNAFETARVLDYKLYELNLNDFSRKMNKNFRRNGGQEEIIYSMKQNMEQLLSVHTTTISSTTKRTKTLKKMAKGMRSVYMLSLLETYAEGSAKNQGIIVVEEPEIFLHPQMQKVAGEILYRLSKKNQVLFTTHSPNLLSNFNTRQIRQMVVDENACSHTMEPTDISRILNDLGYSAADLMNVNFVFIVEGKQDRSRLPLLLKKYYSETFDNNGNLFRIAIINTNSCTNIKTYANLKYINQIYLKDQFLMIRDGDGKNRKELQRQLCSYYADMERIEEEDALPRVRPENVLVLKYYSFENYFLNPYYMTKIGVIKQEDDFYRILLKNWKEHLRTISSGKHLRQVIGKDLKTIDDIKNHMEEIKTYLRGHNLFDIFYGRYKDREDEILEKYISVVPREEFKDILDTIDRFLYFESRKK